MNIKELFNNKKYTQIINLYEFKYKNHSEIENNILIAKSAFFLDQFEISLKYFEHIFLYDKNNYDVNFFMALNYVKLQNFKNAEKFLIQSIKISKNFTNLIQLAELYRNFKFYELAIKTYKATNEYEVDNKIKSKINFNIGICYKNIRKFSEAIDSFNSSLKFDQNFASAFHSIGLCYLEKKNLLLAKKFIKKSIELDPKFYQAYNSLGSVYLKLKFYLEAKKYFEKSISINPNFAFAHNNLGACLEVLHNFDFAISCYLKAFSIDNNLFSISSYLSVLNYINEDPNFLFQEHKKYSSYFIQNLKKNKSSREFNSKNGKIKIAYVSGDFKDHPIINFFIPILKHHQKKIFSIYCLHNSEECDHKTKEIQSLSDYFINISSKTDAQIRELISSEKIDILIDLSGHTYLNRLTLFAQKVAPIQISFMGYASTVGLTTIDYKIVDNYTNTSDTDHCYSEKLIKLKNCFLNFNIIKKYEIEEPPYKKNGYLTFGSFNNLNKISEKTISLWSNILKSIPDSKIILKYKYFKDQNIKKIISDKFLKEGVELSRLKMFSGMNKDDHYNFYNSLDIALDTFPYNGTTTTFEALWMGVPVISLYGKTHQSRVTYSILSNLGYGNLTSNSFEEIVNIALEINKNRDFIDSFKKTIRENLIFSPLMDHQSYVKEYEEKLLEVFRGNNLN